ncbi:hypothetical protein FHG87_005133 [Trinorchestia longiramus]|nr:hypothetical protein FHG87_005133 [Trinorchestia longiramus]
MGFTISPRALSRRRGGVAFNITECSTDGQPSLLSSVSTSAGASSVFPPCGRSERAAEGVPYFQGRSPIPLYFFFLADGRKGRHTPGLPPQAPHKPPSKGTSFLLNPPLQVPTPCSPLLRNLPSCTRPSAKCLKLSRNFANFLAAKAP